MKARSERRGVRGERNAPTTCAPAHFSLLSTHFWI
jgi:hypothetical protein